MAIVSVNLANEVGYGNITVPSTGTGNLLTVLFHSVYVFSITSITDNAPGGSNTYVEVPNTQIGNAGSDDGLHIWYCVNSKPGATNIATSFVGSPSALLTMYGEWSGTNTTSPIADSNTYAGSGTNKRFPVLTAPVGNELFI